jgi:hypothetical protein
VGVIPITWDSHTGVQGVAATYCMQAAMEGLPPGSCSCGHSINILWASEIFLPSEPKWIPKEN